MKVSWARTAAACTLAAWGIAGDAQAGSTDSFDAARGDLAYVANNMASVQAAVAQGQAPRQSAEQRLANGELLFRMKDYSRATVVLSEIIEEFPNTTSYPDALWLRGETYYESRDYLAARRDYLALVDRSTEPRFQIYFGRALGRLVDVALRLDDPPSSLTVLFDRFNQVPSAQVDAALLYAKGKAYFRQSAWNDAAQTFAQVNAPYAHQARYFQGLVAMKMSRAAALADPTRRSSTGVDYKPAIEAFHSVTELSPDTPEHRHVIDLAWMAIGRLFYEMEQYQQASQAYAKVGRDSPEFDTTLYELAWVYVRLGDVQRAERALEVLMISDPNSQYIADGTLLRADLLLRAGSFARALQLYEGVRAQYDPMRAKVESFLAATADVSVYYDKLAQQQLDLLDQQDQLPAVAVRWAREAEDGPLAFAVIDDVNECKTLLHQSRLLIDRLGVLTRASTRVRAFPELESGEQTALGILNRVSRARLAIAQGLDDEEPSSMGGEIGTVRERRRALMAAIEDLPSDAADFAKRDQAGAAQWNALSQELTRRSMEVDTLQATINGLRRVLSDGPQQGVARDPGSTRRFQAELDANERDMKRYRESLSEIRRQVDMGRDEIGLGDARFQSDAIARGQFRDLLEREVRLAAAGAGGTGAASFADRATPLLGQAREYEARLVAILQDFEAQVRTRIADVQRKIDVERANVAGYEQQLAAFDNDARDVVGHVAQRNFGLVRDKLRGIVLRADVGVTEQAWEVREEELDRVRSLQTERARQEQVLDEELREVRDDGVESTPPGN
ncbi:MAG: tetratricopeptide repeat protein [Polyangiaceae bacterium]